MASLAAHVCRHSRKVAHRQPPLCGTAFSAGAALPALGLPASRAAACRVPCPARVCRKVCTAQCVGSPGHSCPPTHLAGPCSEAQSVPAPCRLAHPPRARKDKMPPTRACRHEHAYTSMPARACRHEHAGTSMPTRARAGHATRALPVHAHSPPVHATRHPCMRTRRPCMPRVSSHARPVTPAARPCQASRNRRGVPGAS